MKQILRTFDLNQYRTAAAVEALLVQDDSTVEHAIRSIMANDSKWFGCGSTSQLAAVVAQGNAQCTARVSEARAKVAELTLPQARTIKPVFQQRRYTGTRLDLDRVMQGRPDAWGRFERQHVAEGSRIISLYVPLAGNSYLTAEQISWAPVAAIVLADIFEGAGYRCEIQAIENSISCVSDAVCTQRFLVKRADEPLDLNSVARVSHPSVLRGICFARNAVAFQEERLRIGHGYGDCSGRTLDAGLFGEFGTIQTAPAHSLNEAVNEVKRVLEAFK